MADNILLDAGSGGMASQRLIKEIFVSRFDNAMLNAGDDAACIANAHAPLAFSADSYTVAPLFFPGGSIGSLAIHGTVNDVSMLGARPRWLSCAFIIEEGLPLATLEAIADDMARCAKEAGVALVTGDTKVTPKGACDKVFITTSGIGEIYANPPLSGASAKPGDAVLINGVIGDHGLAVLAARENISFLSSVKSDSAPLADLVESVIEAAGEVHVMRDPTRGGLATTMNEIAAQSNVCIELDEAAIPVSADVSAACSFLGLDPLYLANEGKCVCVLPRKYAEAALNAMRASKYGRKAAIIGKITAAKPGKVILRTRIGGERALGMLEGAQLPRIC